MKKNIKKDMTNKQLIISMVISTILFLCWNIYRDYFDATTTYKISTTEIEKKKTIRLIIPYLNRNLGIRIYSRDDICTKYIENNIIDIKLYSNNNIFSLHNLKLNSLNHKDTVNIVISSKEKLKDCKLIVNIEDTALDLFLLIIFAYTPVMLFIFNLVILTFRFIKSKLKKKVSR